VAHIASNHQHLWLWVLAFARTTPRIGAGIPTHDRSTPLPHGTTSALLFTIDKLIR